MSTPTLIILTAAAVICARLLSFRRGAARHRAGYACLAWLLIIGTGTAVIRILAGESVCAGGWGIALVMVVFAMLTVRARGNVAHIIQLRRF